MQVGFKTDKGKLRPNNEDAYFVLLPDNLFVLCDGVGGGNSGEIASRTTVNEIANFFKNHPTRNMNSMEEIISALQIAIDEVNRKIYNTAISYEENTGMATTLVIFCSKKDKAYIANIGDSRAYIYRSGSLKQLTEDHTYVNSLVKAGILTKEQALLDDRKNMITRAIGAEPNVEPDFFMVDIKEGDVFVICSDGLYDEVSDLDIAKTIREEENMSNVCTALVEKANKNGGHDNISIICIKVTEEDINER